MTYMYYASAVLLVTFSIYQPFITKLDKAKYGALGGASLISPFVIDYYNRATITNIQQQHHHQNMTSILHLTHTNASNMSVPSVTSPQSLFSDAAVLFMLTAFIVSVCGMFTRWHFPITFIKPNASSLVSGFVRHGLSILIILMAITSQYASLQSASFALTTIGLLWYIAGPYFVRRAKVIAAVSVISTLVCFFICCTAYNHSKLYAASILDCTLFVLVLVLSCNAIDYLDTILNTYPHLVQKDKSKQAALQNQASFAYWMAVAQLVANLPNESDLTASPIDDFETAIRALGSASRSWKTMAALFPVNLRQDLCLLYAFFRTADDLVDDAPTPKQCEQNLITIRRFLREVFFLTQANKQRYQQQDLTLPGHINWNYYATLLPNEDVLAIFRNFARISHYLCPRAMSELTDAWEQDLRGEPVKKQKDLLNYAALVSGTFGELCTCAIMYKMGRGNWGKQKNNKARNEDVLSRARATGQCLQLINIARDVIADSLVGRCYVPLQYMPYPPQNMYHILKFARKPLLVGEQTLKSFSIRILGLADQISERAQKGIDGLPEEVQDSIRAAFEIYMAIGPTLVNDPGFPLRAKVPKRQQQWIALRCIYGFRGPVSRALSATFYEMVSIYSRAFTRLSNTRTTAARAAVVAAAVN
ncbi:bifunctional enzyme CarRP-like isoform 1 [Mucor ambiguus]|uniref:15-cis-phytoene synthase n=1 Tax=Mucor ambiguus TaxID=91626 RepID=A0A0C9M5Q0_9FUNG|nr:bifunctional enzyme CarRP-like isoform 1 [Mucor ambiguus]